MALDDLEVLTTPRFLAWQINEEDEALAAAKKAWHRMPVLQLGQADQLLTARILRRMVPTWNPRRFRRGGIRSLAVLHGYDSLLVLFPRCLVVVDFDGRVVQLCSLARFNRYVHAFSVRATEGFVYVMLVDALDADVRILGIARWHII